MKDIGQYADNLNEIKGIYTQKLGKRKATDIIDEKEEAKGEENIEMNQIKISENKK